MTDKLRNAIEAIVKKAIDNKKVFVFGDSVYTPEEARLAMLEHAEDDMKMYGMGIEAYEARQEVCMADVCRYQYQIVIPGGYNVPEVFISDFEESEELSEEDADWVLEKYFMEHPGEVANGTYAVKRILDDCGKAEIICTREFSDAE